MPLPINFALGLEQFVAEVLDSILEGLDGHVEVILLSIGFVLGFFELSTKLLDGILEFRNFFI